MAAITIPKSDIALIKFKSELSGRVYIFLIYCYIIHTLSPGNIGKHGIILSKDLVGQITGNGIDPDIHPLRGK